MLELVLFLLVVVGLAYKLGFMVADFALRAWKKFEDRQPHQKNDY